MKTEKTLVISLIHDAMETVEEARSVEGLSRKDKAALEKVSVEIRKWERSIINEIEKRLIEILEADAAKLTALIKEIDISIAELKKVSEKLARLNQGLEHLAEMVKLSMKLKIL